MPADRQNVSETVVASAVKTDCKMVPRKGRLESALPILHMYLICFVCLATMIRLEQLSRRQSILKAYADVYGIKCLPCPCRHVQCPKKNSFVRIRESPKMVSVTDSIVSPLSCIL